MHIILGSASPRRKNLLATISPSFQVMIPRVDETPLPGEKPGPYCQRISREKTESLLATLDCSKETLLITSDTTVTAQGNILGKPVNRNEAESFLGQLSGKTHQVLSALSLTLCQGDHTREAHGLESTDVTFKDLDHPVISRYLDRITWHDKAGAYAIQDDGEMIVQQISGSLTGIIGFPLRLFFSLASELGVMEKLLTEGRQGIDL